MPPDIAPKIENLVPHAGRMVLLADILACTEESIACRAVIDPKDHHPLAVDGVVPASALVEYAGQAMAVHGGLRAEPGAPPRPGRLVALRQLDLAIDAIATPLEVTVRAQCLGGDESGQIYRFQIHHGERELASGQATIMFADGAQSDRAQRG
ncbi:MAG: hypothetical protein V2J10_13025 [Wenzhouxiangella sp.]|nr:hypothetical protein [Wenzhouxiangella sp.]